MSLESLEERIMSYEAIESLVEQIEEELRTCDRDDPAFEDYVQSLIEERRSLLRILNHVPVPLS